MFWCWRQKRLESFYNQWWSIWECFWWLALSFRLKIKTQFTLYFTLLQRTYPHFLRSIEFLSYLKFSRQMRTCAARTGSLSPTGFGATAPRLCCWSPFLRWARDTGWPLVSSHACAVCRAGDWQSLWQSWPSSWRWQSWRGVRHEVVRGSTVTIRR